MGCSRTSQALGIHLLSPFLSVSEAGCKDNFQSVNHVKFLSITDLGFILKSVGVLCPWIWTLRAISLDLAVNWSLCQMWVSARCGTPGSYGRCSGLFIAPHVLLLGRPSAGAGVPLPVRLSARLSSRPSGTSDSVILERAPGYRAASKCVSALWFVLQSVHVTLSALEAVILLKITFEFLQCLIFFLNNSLISWNYDIKNFSSFCWHFVWYNLLPRRKTNWKQSF